MARALPRPGLTVITDQALATGKLMTVVGAALEGGCRLIQLRRHRTAAGPLLKLAQQLRRLTGDYDAMLVINDRVDIAVESGADGVHLPTAGMRAATVRKIVGPRMLIGRSVHSFEELDALLHDEVDYVHFGPVYKTDSKRTFGSPQGVRKLAEVVKRADGLPVVAVGGIHRGCGQEVARTGVWGAAVIGAVTGANDPRAETEALLAALGRPQD